MFSMNAKLCEWQIRLNEVSYLIKEIRPGELSVYSEGKTILQATAAWVISQAFLKVASKDITVIR